MQVLRRLLPQSPHALLTLGTFQMLQLNKHWLKYIKLQHSFFGKQKTISSLVLLPEPFLQHQQLPLNHEQAGSAVHQNNPVNAEEF
jgi:hypothetical protein